MTLTELLAPVVKRKTYFVQNLKVVTLYNGFKKIWL